MCQLLSYMLSIPIWFSLCYEGIIFILFCNGAFLYVGLPHVPMFYVGTYIER